MSDRKKQLLDERRRIRDENREKRVALQTSLEDFRIKKVFKLPDGMVRPAPSSPP